MGYSLKGVAVHSTQHTPMLGLCRIVNFSEDTAFSIIFKPEVSAAKYFEP